MSINKSMGSKIWYIADGFSPSDGLGLGDGHECICIINDASEEANIKITIFFEDKDPVGDIELTLNSQRCRHLRLNNPKNLSGHKLQTNKPYSINQQLTADVLSAHPDNIAGACIY